MATTAKDLGDKAIANAKAAAAKQQAASKAKQKAKAEPKPKVAKPSLTAPVKNRLVAIAKELDRIESLKVERLDIVRKEAKRGVPTAEIAEAAGLSIPRTRQLLAK